MHENRQQAEDYALRCRARNSSPQPTGPEQEEVQEQDDHQQWIDSALH
jgi:hypothetical protein